MSQSQKILSLLPHIIYTSKHNKFIERHKQGVNTFPKKEIYYYHLLHNTQTIYLYYLT